MKYKDMVAAGLASEVPAGALRVDLIGDEFNPTRPGSLLVTAVMNPVLVAALTDVGATARGSASIVFGLGGDDPAAEVPRRLITTLARGSLYPAGGTYTATSKAPKNLFPERNPDGTGGRAKDVIGGYWALRGMLASTPAASALPEGEVDHGTPAWDRINRVQDLHPSTQHAAGWFFAEMSVENRVGWVRMKTHFPETVAPPEVCALLDQRPAGRAKRTPRPVRPVDAFPVLAWAASRGIQILDPHGVWAQLRKAVSGGVLVWPRPGRPAEAAVSVPPTMVEGLNRDLVRRFGLRPHNATPDILTGESTVADVAELISALPSGGHVIDDHVADVVDMVTADEYLTEPRLYDFQREVVGQHLATSRGLVVALDPGMGKTITTLTAWRARSHNHTRFRGLVVTEAALRTQWAGEVEAWFPEATVVKVTGSKDTDKLVEALETTDGPLVVIVAYAAMAPVSDTAAFRSWEKTYGFLVEEWKAAQDRGEQLMLTADQLAAALEAASDTEVREEALLDLTPVATAAEDAAAAVEAQVVVEPPAYPSRLGEVLLDQLWDELAMDEAEALRGTGSKSAKGAWALRDNAKVAVVLTGTPINRSIDDIGRLVSFARNEPSMFDASRGGHRLSNQFNMANDEDTVALQAALGPTVFRRVTSEATGKIPKVNPTVIMLRPSPAELALSQAATGELKRLYEDLRDKVEAEAELHPDSPEAQEIREQVRAARGAWLGGTTLARQAASDPAALLGANSSAAEVLAAQGLIAEATAEPGTKRIRAVNDIAERVMNGERVLVFTEFATVARGLISDLDEAGVRVGQVLGGGGARRDKDVWAFTNGDLDALVLTSSGEKGLNLQAATTLVHYDLPWTPKGVLQRTGRARRLASGNDSVEVVFYVMERTIEERVAALVVSRAVEAMRALDTSRGLEIAQTDLGSAFSGLAEAASQTREGRKMSVLMEVTRQLVEAV